MRRTRWAWVLIALGCGLDEPPPAPRGQDEPASAPADGAPQGDPVSAARSPQDEPGPGPARTVPTKPDPPTAFDGASVASIDATVVEVLDAGAGVCGILHSVGALLVEVDGAGDPAPRLVVYVSCPADIPHRGLLNVGQRLHIDLHARKQSWPRPPTKLPEGVPVRYAKTVEPAEPAAPRDPSP